MQLIIREATPADAATIAANNSKMALETEGRALAPDTVGPGVTALLEDPQMGRYWVAEAEGRIVGQLMVTYEWSDWRNGMIWWIQSVYVNEVCRRGGIFSSLYHHVESLASAEPRVCGIRLYVEKENRRAQQTYATLGMTKPNYVVMESIFRRRGDD